MPRKSTFELTPEELVFDATQEGSLVNAFYMLGVHTLATLKLTDQYKAKYPGNEDVDNWSRKDILSGIFARFAINAADQDESESALVIGSTLGIQGVNETTGHMRRVEPLDLYIKMGKIIEAHFDDETEVEFKLEDAGQFKLFTISPDSSSLKGVEVSGACEEGRAEYTGRLATVAMFQESIGDARVVVNVNPIPQDGDKLI